MEQYDKKKSRWRCLKTFSVALAASLCIPLSGEVMAENTGGGGIYRNV